VLFVVGLTWWIDIAFLRTTAKDGHLFENRRLHGVLQFLTWTELAAAPEIQP
jgi:hypothetical protein